jgi:EAL domain-containing protein (putative c-di-GMP-specific phosphodiesterase class I)
MRNKEPKQVEVLGRLQYEDGEMVPAELFIPMANRHRLTPSFDLAILKRLFGRMASGMITDEEVAINISVYSIHDAELLEWLSNAMSNDRKLSQRLVFEFTEFGLVQDREGVEKFVTEIRKYGANFAVDNFGLHQTAFDYLQQMKPRYIKLNPSYVRDLNCNQKNQFFISSVVRITRPLEILVIALGIEDINMLELLDTLGVDGYQGYVNGKMNELG